MRWWGVSVAVEVASSRWRLQPSDGGSVLPAAGYIHSAAASSSRPRIHPRDGACIPRFRLHPLAVCSISGSPATTPHRRLDPLAACSILGSPATSPRRLFHPGNIPSSAATHNCKCPGDSILVVEAASLQRRRHPLEDSGFPAETAASPVLGCISTASRVYGYIPAIPATSAAVPAASHARFMFLSVMILKEMPSKK